MANASIVPDLEGSYQFELVIFDGQDFADDSVVVEVSAANIPPSVDAGDNQLLFFGDTAFLEGVAVRRIRLRERD